MAKRRKPGKAIPVRASRNGAELCFQCGMCCDGTLFANTSLEPGEAEFASERGLIVTQADTGKTVAAQPCPAFQEGMCAIFDRGRPQVCVSYRCGLLQAYEAATQSLDDCLEIVTTVRTLTRDLEHAMGVRAGAYSAVGNGEFMRTRWDDLDQATQRRIVATQERLRELGVDYFGWPLNAEADDVEALTLTVSTRT